MSLENKSEKKNKSGSDKVSKRFYGVAKAREPWYLKILFWVLLGILLIGGSVTSFFIIKDHRITKSALGFELKIMRMLNEFEEKIQDEKDLFVDEKYDKAREVGLENYENSLELRKYIEYYFNTFDEKVDGYSNVVEYRDKFEYLSIEFYELNKDDPRLLENDD